MPDLDRADRARLTAAKRVPLRSRSAIPQLILLPLFMATLMAAAWSLWLELFLGPSFGLSDGRDTPWPGGLAIIWLIGFWTMTLISRVTRRTGPSILALIAVWAVTWWGWIHLEPVYDGHRIAQDPGRFVTEDGWLIPTVLVSLVVWWLGQRASDELIVISGEEMRGAVQRAWAALGTAIVFAALISSSAGDRALADARFAVPIVAVASIAVIGGAEVQSTRRLVLRRGGQAPGWARWYRMTGGFSLGIGLITIAVLAALSPGAMGAMVSAIGTVARLLGFVLQYVFYALIFMLYQIVRGISWIVTAIFGDVFGPFEPPERPLLEPPAGEQQRMEVRETEPWEYATEFRWFVILLLILIVGLIVFRLRRGYGPADQDGLLDEERESMFSADLARKQLRDLFRRKARIAPPPRLDLDRAPLTVRESMIHLQTLASREGVGRREAETPDDFVRRLRAVWSGLGEPLNDLGRRYERIRYGEQDDPPDGADARAAASDWSRIHERRRDAANPDRR